LDLLELVQKHLERVEDFAGAAKVALQRIELMSYKVCLVNMSEEEL